MMVAHESMCFPIPERVPDEQAALADPFSVALHAIRKVRLAVPWVTGGVERVYRRRRHRRDARDRGAGS
jgi:hypothetical protein